MKRFFIIVVFVALCSGALFVPSQPAKADDTSALANAIAAEQIIVISTDDRFYTQYPRDSMKIDPLTGLPFARDEKEEFAAAVGMNLMLRNPHHAKLLHLTVTAFPILERSIIGVGIHFWKAPWH